LYYREESDNSSDDIITEGLDHSETKEVDTEETGPFILQMLHGKKV